MTRYYEVASLDRNQDKIDYSRWKKVENKKTFHYSKGRKFEVLETFERKRSTIAKVAIAIAGVVCVIATVGVILCFPQVCKFFFTNRQVYLLNRQESNLPNTENSNTTSKTTISKDSIQKPAETLYKKLEEKIKICKDIKNDLQEMTQYLKRAHQILKSLEPLLQFLPPDYKPETTQKTADLVPDLNRENTENPKTILTDSIKNLEENLSTLRELVNKSECVNSLEFIKKTEEKTDLELVQIIKGIKDEIKVLRQEFEKIEIKFNSLVQDINSAQSFLLKYVRDLKK